MFDDYEEAWRSGDHARAKAIAKRYLEESPMQFAPYHGKGTAQLVGMVAEARRAGNEDERRRVDVYLLSSFEPQHITGKMQVG